MLDGENIASDHIHLYSIRVEISWKVKKKKRRKKRDILGSKKKKRKKEISSEVSFASSMFYERVLHRVSPGGKKASLASAGASLDRTCG